MKRKRQKNIKVGANFDHTQFRKEKFLNGLLDNHNLGQIVKSLLLTKRDMDKLVNLWQIKIN